MVTKNKTAEHPNATKLWEQTRGQWWARWLRVRVAERLLNGEAIVGASDADPKSLDPIRAELQRWHNQLPNRGQKFDANGRKLVTLSGMNSLVPNEKGNVQKDTAKTGLWAKYERGDVAPSDKTREALYGWFPFAREAWDVGPDGVPIWPILKGKAEATTLPDAIWTPIVQRWWHNVAWRQAVGKIVQHDHDLMNGDGKVVLHLNQAFAFERPKRIGLDDPNAVQLALALSKASPTALLATVLHALAADQKAADEREDGRTFFPSFYGLSGSLLLAIAATQVTKARGAKYRWNDFHDDDELFDRFRSLRSEYVLWAQWHGIRDVVEDWLNRVHDAYLERNGYTALPDIEAIRALKRGGRYVLAVERRDLVRMARRSGTLD